MQNESLVGRFSSKKKGDFEREWEVVGIALLLQWCFLRLVDGKKWIGFHAVFHNIHRKSSG